MAVRWVNYLWDEPHPVSHDEAKHLEQLFGVELPTEYKALVIKCQGMAPEPGVFDVGRGDNVVNVLLTITEEEGHEKYSVPHTYKILKPLVPTGIFPFAETPGGESICFDYRAQPQNPSIVLVTVEAFIYPIADTFKAFLDKLHD